METLRYHCVQISPLWFASLRSEKVVMGKVPEAIFFMVVMEMLKYTGVPSFTSVHCMVYKFKK